MAWELGFHVCLYEPSVRGPVVVGDTGLYYIWRDEGCLTADKVFALLRVSVVLGILEWTEERCGQ